MKSIFRLLTSTVLIFVLIAGIFPCGPAYITPIFEYTAAPENPFENFAAGKIGILKPTYHRSVLFAAYRYFNGGTFNAAEQKALVEVWEADFNNKDFRDNDVDEAVKSWLEARKSIVEKEEKTLDIYTEREYGGYDFFPNCTKSAFETAAATLKDRAASHGSGDRFVKDWVAAQDKVFTNCASGKQTPGEPDASMPKWLQKDRAYQAAAASFYALNFADARRRFAAIAEDVQSPWQETADYLVGRTMIRQASLSKDEQAAKRFYAEAEDYLYRLSVGGNKYADSAEALLALVKYRLHPEQRVRELAQKLSYQSTGEDLRQNLIDYTWLLDKFEKQALEKEEQRKKALESPNSNSPINANAIDEDSRDAKDDGKLKIYLYTDDYQKNWTISVEPDATDEEAIAEAEKTVGMPLTDMMKQQVRDGRKTAYQNMFSEARESGYEGGYYGEEEPTLSLLPAFLRSDDLTDWLFAYQIDNDEAYLYALERFKQYGTDIWLATAISKASKASTGLQRLFEAADKTPVFSPAFPTVFYHRLRLLIETEKHEQARKLLDEYLNSPVDIPVSTRNQFVELRFELAQDLNEGLFYALRRPFALDWGGDGMTLDEIIAQNKSWYNPKYETVSKDEYDRRVEEEFAAYRRLQNEMMLDDRTTRVFNDHFSTEVLIEAARSTVLPAYLRERFIKTAFVRALLLADHKTAERLAPEIAKLEPERKLLVEQFLAAKPGEKRLAALFLILKNENATPYLTSGFGTPVEQGTYATRWWCKPFDEVYDERARDLVPRTLSPRPAFLTDEQSRAAQAEMKKLKDIGDAPKYFAEQIFEIARRLPADKRVPESLFLVYQANDWDKYGCGGHQDLRKQAAEILRTRYPKSAWTRQLENDGVQ